MNSIEGSSVKILLMMSSSSGVKDTPTTRSSSFLSTSPVDSSSAPSSIILKIDHADNFSLLLEIKINKV